jgi:single-strand DNA-binding protein
MNLVILIGRVGQDPETKQVGETSVSRVRLATTKKYKDKSGNLQEETQWHSLDFWGSLSDTIAKHVKKGCKIAVEGEIQHRKHNDKWYTTIRVSKLNDIQWPKGFAVEEPAPSPAPQQEGPDDLPF